MEKTILHFYKFILGVKQSTPDNAVYGELGRRPCQLRYMWKQIKLWNRLLGLPRSRLSYKALQVASELGSNNSFVKNITNTFHEIEKLPCWNNQQQISNSYINSDIKESIYKLYDKSWYKQITEATKGNKGNSKLRSYKLFKANLHLEKYLKCINIRAHRVALAKFRMSAHQLRIETGRIKV